jgi:glycosyltransferase involved in cell wall biosynthesis
MGVKRKAPAAPKPDTAPRVLHLHSTFAAGGKELRCVQLMNAFGPALRHSVVSAMPEQMAAREHIKRGVKVDFPKNFPSLTGFPSPGRLVALAKAMKPYDLVLTYNWGAMDAVMAHTVFAQNMGLPPLVHHEDGFNEDEASELKTRRNWYRRIAMGKSSGLVVPSKRLERIALDTWQQPRGRVLRFANGIDTETFAQTPDPTALRVLKRKDEFWVGTLAGLRKVKQLDQLVRAFSILPDNWQLVLIGEGPEREAIREVANHLEVSHRVHMPGAISDPARVIGLFDIFALSSASEQFPISVVEAMAAGLPVVAPDVGDIKDMVAQPNRTLITKPGNIEEMGAVLAHLAQDPALRRELGEANQQRAREMYDETQMVANYRKLYSSAMGREF